MTTQHRRVTMQLLCVVTLAAFACSTRADDDTSPPTDNPFAPAIAAAQQRSVRVYGAGIGREHGYASGIIVSGEGHVLTADGVYLQGRRLIVTLNDGGIYPAKLVRRSEALQSALLKIDAKTPTYFELDGEPNVEPGDWVLAVSNAFKIADRGERLSVNMGVVSMRGQLDTKRRKAQMEVASDVILVDAITANPGAPGGALVTVEGRLAGMIGKLIQSQDTNTWLNYAIPADLLKRFVDGQPIEPPTDAPPPTVVDGKPYIGIRLFTLSGKRAPAYIDRVRADSPAADAGLRKDDLILVVGETRVRNVSEAEDALATLQPGTEATIVVKRRSDVVQVMLTPTVEVDDE